MARPLRVEYEGAFYHDLGLSYSAAMKANRRLEAEIGSDNAFKKRIGKIDLALSNVRGCPLLMILE
jgi:hypothetical protein